MADCCKVWRIWLVAQLSQSVFLRHLQLCPCLDTAAVACCMICDLSFMEQLTAAQYMPFNVE